MCVAHALEQQDAFFVASGAASVTLMAVPLAGACRREGDRMWRGCDGCVRAQVSDSQYLPYSYALLLHIQLALTAAGPSSEARAFLDTMW